MILIVAVTILVVNIIIIHGWCCRLFMTGIDIMMIATRIL